jgi:DNA recombination protein RmuC
MDLLLLFIGLLAGLIAALVVYLMMKAGLHRKQQEALVMEKDFVSRSSEREKELGVLNERLANFDQEIKKLDKLLQEETKKTNDLNTENTRLLTEQKNILEKLDKQKSEMEELQKKLQTDFENIANQILRRNTEDLSNYNKEKLADILNPLREKLQQFELKVSTTYEKSLKDTTGLQTEVKKLYELNQKLGEEASNLTRALKGDVKKQGNWGEVILERILERSGLRKGFEYEIQVSATDSEGKLIRPDVIIHLPDKKHLVVDSKVSLVAYEQWVNSDKEEDKKRFAKAHVDSVRSHIKILSGKHYQGSEQLNSPDFVLLFIPIESSFSVAVQEDNDLFSFAWDNKIVIVSPSTLLATLLTIASMWKQENQTRNVMEIARQTGLLYDKFVGFLEAMEKLDKNLDLAQKSFSFAMNRLQSGSGNLITSVEKIRKLGVKTNKNIPDKFLAGEDDLLPEGPEEQV